MQIVSENKGGQRLHGGWLSGTRSLSGVPKMGAHDRTVKLSYEGVFGGMKLRLILLRHAKSGWDDPGLSDHDRPLTDRGMRDAENVGAWLTKNGFVPGLVLSSTATTESVEERNAAEYSKVGHNRTSLVSAVSILAHIRDYGSYITFDTLI